MTDDADAARLWLGYTRPRLDLDYLPPPELKPRRYKKRPKVVEPKQPRPPREPKEKREHRDSLTKWNCRSRDLNMLYLKGKPPKTKFEVDMIPRAKQLCEWGLTDHQIAVAFGVDVKTLVKWQTMFDGFAEAFVIGDEVASAKVERALYTRALGYEYDAEKLLVVDKQVIRASYKEHVPADIGAAKFWLLNRRKAKWRDLQQHEVGRVGEFDEMTTDELREFIRAEAAQISASDEPSPDVGGAGGPGTELK